MAPTTTDELLEQLLSGAVEAIGEAQKLVSSKDFQAIGGGQALREDLSVSHSRLLRAQTSRRAALQEVEDRVQRKTSYETTRQAASA